MYKIVRDTKFKTNETLSRNLSLIDAINYIKEIMVLNNYQYREFKTMGSYLGFTVIKSKFNNNPIRIYYIIKENKGK